MKPLTLLFLLLIATALPQTTQCQDSNPNRWSSLMKKEGWNNGLKKLLQEKNSPDRILFKQKKGGKKIALIQKDRNGNYYACMYHSNGKAREYYFGLYGENLDKLITQINKELSGNGASLEFTSGKQTSSANTLASEKKGTANLHCKQKATVAKSTPKDSPSKIQTHTTLKSCIHPPIKELEIKREVFEIDPDRKTEIKTTNGTKITIPPQAFVKASNGEPVKDSIQFWYREYNNVASIFASGIPMMVNNGGQELPLSSAGMFEIRAFKGEEELKIKQDKKLTIEFKSTSEAQDFNFYQLNEKSGNWNQLIPAKDMPVANRTVSDMVYRFYHYQNKDQAIYDTTTFEGRFYDTNYVHISRRTLTRAATEPRTALRPSGWRFGYNKEIPTVLCEKLIKIKAFTNNKTNQVLLKISGYKEANPELYDLGKICFIMNTDSLGAAKKLADGLNLQRFYSDFRVIYTGKDWTLLLKHSSGVLKLDHLTIKNFSSHNSTYTVRNPDNLYKNYLYTLHRRARQFNEDLTAKKCVSNTYFTTNSREEYLRKGYDSLLQFATVSEAKMSYNNFLNYFHQEQNKIWVPYRENTPNNPTLIYAFAVSGLGIYNCDQIKRLSSPVVLNVKIQNSNKETINPCVVYVIDEKINGVITYYVPTTEIKSFSISNPAKANSRLLFADKEGNLYLTKSSEIANLPSIKKMTELTTRKLDKAEVANIESLKSLISF